MNATPALSVLLVALALASCQPAVMAEHDAQISHPLTAKTQMAVAVFDGPVLSDFDLDRLKRMAAESLRRGAGTVRITATTKSDEEDAAIAFSDRVAALFHQEGVRAIEAKLRVAADAALQIVVEVPVWVAVVPDCGTFERGLNPDHANAPNSNWGCSIQRNTALMLQNPADLIRARDSSGRDANRAADVLGKYQRGAPTSSSPEQQSAGSASPVGNGK